MKFPEFGFAQHQNENLDDGCKTNLKNCCNENYENSAAVSVDDEIMELQGSAQPALPSKSSLKRSLYICAVAFMMNYAAYGGLVFLQSSINIEEGLGAAGLSAIYATSSFSSLFVTPFLIDVKGAKMAIVLGEMGILLYTLANFFPSWSIIIPAAICHGLTESSAWAGSSVYVTYLGEKYSECLSRESETMLQKKNSKETCVYRFFSVFYAFVYLSQVLGNALVSAVLYGARQGPDRNLSNATRTLDYTSDRDGNGIDGRNPLITSTSAWEGNKQGKPWELCGALECQADFIYDEQAANLDKYEPRHASVLLLLSFFVVIQVIFTAVHAFALPPIPSRLPNSTSHPSTHESTADRKVTGCAQKINSLFNSSSLLPQVKAEIKQTFHHMVSPLHLLVFPLVFYCGVVIAFNVTEFTRAYVSCAIGVENVGFVVMVYGMSSMVVSGASTKLIPLLGRNIFMVIMFLAHIGTYLFSLLWIPSADKPWLIYLNSLCLGACDGIMTNILQGMFAIYFENNVAIAFSVKNFATNLGIVAGTAWSTSLCINVKIYIIFGLLLSSMVAYAAAERLHQVRQSKTKTKSASWRPDGETNLSVSAG